MMWMNGDLIKILMKLPKRIKTHCFFRICVLFQKIAFLSKKILLMKKKSYFYICPSSPYVIYTFIVYIFIEEANLLTYEGRVGKDVTSFIFIFDI
jgi:hypothetical protein